MIYSVNIQKGGTGKTTTAHALAAGLAKRGCKVLIIDADPQGTITTACGGDRYIAGLFDVLTGQAKIADVIQVTENGLHVITGTPSLYYPPQLPPDALKKALQPVKKAYDHIVIDTAPTLGAIAVWTLTAADAVIIPAHANKYDADGVADLYKGAIAYVKKNTNKGLTIAGILLTFYNPRKNVAKVATDDMRQLAAEIGTKVFQSTIRNAAALEESQYFEGENIFSYDSRSKVAQDYDAFINELLKG